MLIFNKKIKVFSVLFLIFLIAGSFFYFTENTKASGKYYYFITIFQDAAPYQYTTKIPDLSKEECEEQRKRVVDESTARIKPTVSECIEATLLPDKQEVNTNTDTQYTLLAPIPGLDNGDFKEFETNPTKNSCPFGKYINILIKLLIGVSGVLAMIMIAYGGIQYITGAAPSEKGSAKDTIVNAILGLVIALGAYLILYTLNPNLLNFCLDKQLPSVSVTIEEEKPTADIFSTNEAIPTTPVGLCTEGIIKINTAGGTFVLCERIANDIKNTIDKAWSQGYRISGWGWRSKEKQIELRKKNGCPDIYNSPPSQCRIPTAIPGTSMHESGLAIDFTCDGVAIEARDNKCYVWLKTNKSLHKLTNLASEAWHWSTTGK